ncbi:MAG: hypothetical protein Q4E99_02655 [Bacillota bacterium]|nr:hypothetical protein [Bacillota bacterium]
MKPFIVFIALILVFTSLGAISSDLARYKQINIALKAVAEEIACGGGLMTAGTEATEILSIDYVEADKYAKFIINKAGNSPIFSDGKLTYRLTPDQDRGQKIMATVTYTIGGRSISRKATYEWIKENGK